MRKKNSRHRYYTMGVVIHKFKFIRVHNAIFFFLFPHKMSVCIITIDDFIACYPVIFFFSPIYKQINKSKFSMQRLVKSINRSVSSNFSFNLYVIDMMIKSNLYNMSKKKKKSGDSHSHEDHSQEIALKILSL